MQIFPNQLADSFQSEFLPVYVTGGPEVVIHDEVRDAIVASALANDMEEVDILRFDDRRGRSSKSVPWGEIFDDLSAASLFGGRKLLEVRVQSATMDEAVVESCIELARDPPPNRLLLRIAGLDYRDKRKKWYSQLRGARGVALVIADELNTPDSIEWMMRRAADAGLKLTREAAAKLGDYCENNLIAARQELDKFKLLLEPGATVDEAAIELADVRNADLLQLLDVVFGGEIEMVAKRLDALEEQRAASQSYELGVLAMLTQTLKLAHAKLADPKLAIPAYQRRRVDSLIRRHGDAGVEALLFECAQFNSMYLGMARGNAGDLMRNLLFSIAGNSEATMEDEFRWRVIDRQAR